MAEIKHTLNINKWDEAQLLRLAQSILALFEPYFASADNQYLQKSRELKLYEEDSEQYSYSSLDACETSYGCNAMGIKFSKHDIRPWDGNSPMSKKVWMQAYGLADNYQLIFRDQFGSISVHAVVPDEVVVTVEAILQKTLS